MGGAFVMEDLLDALDLEKQQIQKMADAHRLALDRCIQEAFGRILEMIQRSFSGEGDVPKSETVESSQQAVDLAATKLPRKPTLVAPSQTEQPNWPILDEFEQDWTRTPEAELESKNCLSFDISKSPEHGRSPAELVLERSIEPAPEIETTADQHDFGAAPEEQSTSEDLILKICEQDDMMDEDEDSQGKEKHQGVCLAPEEDSMSENAILTLPHSVPDALEQDNVEEQETEERGDAEEDDESQRSMFTDCRVDTKQDVQGQGTGNEEVNEELAGAKETLPADERRISSGSTRSGTGATEEEDMPRLGAHGPLESTPKKARTSCAVSPQTGEKVWGVAFGAPVVYKAAPPELQRQLRSKLSLETPGGSGLAGALPGSLGFDRLSPPPLAAADRRPSGQGFLAVPIKGPSEATGSTGQWSGSGVSPGQSLRSWRQDAWKRDDWNDWKEQKEWSSWSTSKESWPQQKKEAWNPKRWGRSRGSWS